MLETLGRYIVADDVDLADRSAAFVRVGVEGPRSTERLAAAASEGADALAAVEPEGWTTLTFGEGVAVVATRFGWSGETAWQLFVPAGSEASVASAIGVRVASLAALEVLRIEAGVPRLGPELDEEVFPDEARLDAAISRTKGCYTGQEIVARLYSRGAVNHLLVQLELEGDALPAADSPLLAGGKRTGEITSACVSPTRGALGLGYVRREHAEPGTELTWEGADGSRKATVL